MSIQKKRTYNSENRNAQAAQTRHRILESAKQLFQLEGFECVTIEKLAQAAEVSIPTVYSLFQSKRGVLFALMDEALPTEEFNALVEAGKREKSAKKRLIITAKLSRQLYDSESAQIDIFQGASLLAPELKEQQKEREERRYLRQEEFVETLMKDKALLKGLGLSQARDILWAFTGRDIYRMFVIERGWTSEEYEKWLAQLLIKTLLGDD
ncbi:MAG TPA: TetR/AcrR family transcriptional regulator [Rhabdochlamydiaceae bacterium]|nr:TetR/AcrR family transcriptional regulator [Rhabdochlamydiaceae bacterium]HSX38910.1 TetR/AcrR family transcriptional regulator [Chlamydiales bacterium]